MSVFISYSSADDDYARRLYKAFQLNHISAWFAPKDISGGQNFAEEIGAELTRHKSTDEFERIMEDNDHLTSSSTDVFLLLLSEHSMRSMWVKKELMMAIREKIPVLVVQVDHAVLTKEFDYLLQDLQIIYAYHLKKNGLDEIVAKLSEYISFESNSDVEQLRLSYDEIGIFPIMSGDPYYVEGNTLKTRLTEHIFYLAPPKEFLEHPENYGYFGNHSYSQEDQVFGEKLHQVCQRIEIPGLANMIEVSRHKIFLQFLNQENGCYYNNKKYGIYSISSYERTEDISEDPILRLDFFTTDYFTHRVMKDVCKILAKENSSFFKQLNYNSIGDARIFFTSLGINLILKDSKDNVLLTGRSTNAAETYKQHRYSVSVIEGVSLSDYDMYEKRVSLHLAIQRGIKEELGVDSHMLNWNSLKIYDLFVNPSNMECGLACSIDLQDSYDLQRDIIPLKGKDEILEVADKKNVSISRLRAFLRDNRAVMLPQAVYTVAVFLEANGTFFIDHYNRKIFQNDLFIMGKSGNAELCGDMYVWDKSFIAVLDGATPKGSTLWDGMKGDVFVSHLLADAILKMDPDIEAQDVIEYLNEVIHKQYVQRQMDFAKLPPEERLQCSVVIYSVKRREIWSFGDCLLKINGREFRQTKEGDQVFASLRAFCIQIERDRLEASGKKVEKAALSAYGRECILPYLKQLTSLANRNVPFGYDVLDGGIIYPDHVKVYAVQKNDHVVLASDGYTKLFDNLEDTEKYLADALKRDADCIDLLRGTKGVADGDESFDDRTFVSFRVM